MADKNPDYFLFGSFDLIDSQAPPSRPAKNKSRNLKLSFDAITSRIDVLCCLIGLPEVCNIVGFFKMNNVAVFATLLCTLQGSR